jgi:hypothetical protein
VDRVGELVYDQELFSQVNAESIARPVSPPM